MRTIKITLANGSSEPIREWYRGCYRVTIDDETFGQVRRDGTEWKAEIRYIETGAIVRFAGLWKARREAVAEIVDYRNGERQRLIFRQIAASAHSVYPNGCPA